MSGETKRPRRRFDLTICIGGDTWDDVAWSVQDLLTHILDHGPCCSSVSGSASAGHSVTVVENPEMTHDRYHEQLETYLAERRALESPPSGRGT